MTHFYGTALSPFYGDAAPRKRPSRPTIRRWWENHWQVLYCPCYKPDGEHHYATHTEAINHVSNAYANDPIRRIRAELQAWAQGLRLFTKHAKGES